MTQKYRPITAAGVKSTLKSLRTRTGLQAIDSPLLNWRWMPWSGSVQSDPCKTRGTTASQQSSRQFARLPGHFPSRTGSLLMLRFR